MRNLCQLSELSTPGDVLGKACWDRTVSFQRRTVELYCLVSVQAIGALVIGRVGCKGWRVKL